MTASWLPVATLLAGLVGTFGGVSLQARNQRLRDEEARVKERAGRSADFQRETLLSLQTALNALTLVTVRVHVHHRKSFSKRGGRYGLEPVDDDLDVATGNAARDVALLCERVRDDTLRAEIESVERAHLALRTIGLNDGPSHEVAARAQTDSLLVTAAAAELQRKLGVGLRELL